MNTTRLYEFLVLANVLNYSKAAQALYISQSVLSRHIQELEEELGAPVFRRTTHSMALTEAGRILAKNGQVLVEKWDAAQSRLRRHNIPPKGSVRIAMALEFSYANHLRSFFRNFTNRYSDIELIYDVIPHSTPKEICLDYDLFFTPCTFHNLPASVHSLLIHSYGTYLALPPGHPLMAKSAVHLHQLIGETLVVPYAEELFGPYAQNYLLTEKATKGRIASIKVDNLSTALFLVSMGKGICIVPRHAQNMLPTDSFFIAVSDHNCRFDEHLYYQESENTVAKLFFEEFTESLKNS